jgi:hypothetical protein
VSLPPTLDECLNRTDSAAKVMAHARTLLRLTRIYEEIAPGQLAGASRVANTKSGRIIIHADNGAVAAKLRQLAGSLRDGFILKGSECNGIDVRVQPRPAAFDQEPPESRKPGLSAGSKTHLHALCVRLPAQSPLRQSVERLLKVADQE